MSFYPLHADLRRAGCDEVRLEPQATRRMSYVAARSWWLLKTHVAETQGLPREAAGSEPRPPIRR